MALALESLAVESDSNNERVKQIIKGQLATCEENIKQASLSNKQDYKRTVLNLIQDCFQKTKETITEDTEFQVLKDKLQNNNIDNYDLEGVKAELVNKYFNLHWDETIWDNTQKLQRLELSISPTGNKKRKRNNLRNVNRHKSLFSYCKRQCSDLIKQIVDDIAAPYLTQLENNSQAALSTALLTVASNTNVSVGTTLSGSAETTQEDQPNDAQINEAQPDVTKINEDHVVENASPLTLLREDFNVIIAYMKDLESSIATLRTKFKEKEDAHKTSCDTLRAQKTNIERRLEDAKAIKKNLEELIPQLDDPNKFDSVSSQIKNKLKEFKAIEVGTNNTRLLDVSKNLTSLEAIDLNTSAEAIALQAAQDRFDTFVRSITAGNELIDDLNSLVLFIENQDKIIELFTSLNQVNTELIESGEIVTGIEEEIKNVREFLGLALQELQNLENALIQNPLKSMQSTPDQYISQTYEDGHTYLDQYYLILNGIKFERKAALHTLLNSKESQRKILERLQFITAQLKNVDLPYQSILEFLGIEIKDAIIDIPNKIDSVTQSRDALLSSVCEAFSEVNPDLLKLRKRKLSDVLTDSLSLTRASDGQALVEIGSSLYQLLLIFNVDLVNDCNGSKDQLISVLGGDFTLGHVIDKARVNNEKVAGGLALIQRLTGQLIEELKTQAAERAKQEAAAERAKQEAAEVEVARYIKNFKDIIAGNSCFADPTNENFDLEKLGNLGLWNGDWDRLRPLLEALTSLQAHLNELGELAKSKAETLIANVNASLIVLNKIKEDKSFYEDSEGDEFSDGGSTDGESGADDDDECLDVEQLSNKFSEALSQGDHVTAFKRAVDLLGSCTKIPTRPQEDLFFRRKILLDLLTLKDRRIDRNKLICDLLQGIQIEEISSDYGPIDLLLMLLSIIIRSDNAGDIDSLLTYVGTKMESFYLDSLYVQIASIYAYELYDYKKAIVYIDKISNECNQQWICRQKKHVLERVNGNKPKKDRADFHEVGHIINTTQELNTVLKRWAILDSIILPEDLKEQVEEKFKNKFLPEAHCQRDIDLVAKWLIDARGDLSGITAKFCLNDLCTNIIKRYKANDGSSVLDERLSRNEQAYCLLDNFIGINKFLFQGIARRDLQSYLEKNEILATTFAAAVAIEREKKNMRNDNLTHIIALKVALAIKDKDLFQKAVERCERAYIKIPKKVVDNILRALR